MIIEHPEYAMVFWTPAVIGIAGTLVGWCIAVTQAGAIQDREYARRQVGAARVLLGDVLRIREVLSEAYFSERYHRMDRVRTDVPAIHPWVESLIPTIGAAFPDVLASLMRLQAHLANQAAAHRTMHGQVDTVVDRRQAARGGDEEAAQQSKAADARFDEVLTELRAAEVGSRAEIGYLVARLEGITARGVPSLPSFLFPTLYAAGRFGRQKPSPEWQVSDSPLA